MPSTLSLTSIPRRALLIALPLALTLLCLLAGRALAAEGSQYGTIGQYGEVTRFGGFDSTAYDNDKYDGTLTPGKFLDPVGFAVDSDDPEGGGTSVYVLDRVSGWDSQVGASGTEWRLQKLSDTGAVLGTTEFYLPKVTVEEADFEVPVGVVGLAVDHTTGTVYTVLYETVGEEEAATQYAYEVIGWSTTPTGGKLVAPGASTDSVSKPASGYTAPGLISDSTQLAVTHVYNPVGLAVDDAGGATHLAIAGDSVARSSRGAVDGPAIVEQVSTSATSTGDETGTWSASSLTSPSVPNASTEDATAIASGISTNPDGSLSVLLGTGGAQLDSVNISANLGDPAILASKEIDTPDLWADPLKVAGAENYSQHASAQAVSLDNGLYASDFWASSATYWSKATTEGIRLLSPSSSGGVLSSLALPPTSVFDTLGNSEQSGACYIGDEGAGNTGTANNTSLAAGANGSIWILTAGQDSSYGASAADETGRDVIELAPDASKACVAPTGTFSVTDKTATDPHTQPASATEPLKISVGHTVEFNASSIDYPTTEATKGGAVYAYEWAPTGGAYTTTDTTEQRPAETTTYQYATPGVYTAKLKLLGDFGEYYETATIEVQTAGLPTGSFTAPSTAQTGQTVNLDASASQPASGAQISNYHWSFGDGQTDDTQSPTDSHAYASAGTYTVTLTVRDNDDQTSNPVTQQIVVSSPSSNEKGTGGTTTTGGGTTTTGGGTTTATIDRSATNVDPRVAEVSGKLQVELTCPATKSSCAGTVAAKTASAVAAGKSRKKSVLTVASASFSLTAGAGKTLTISLTSAGAALLKKDKTLKIDVVVAAHDSYGDPLTKTLTLTLREPPAKKPAGHKK